MLWAYLMLLSDHDRDQATRIRMVGRMNVTERIDYYRGVVAKQPEVRDIVRGIFEQWVEDHEKVARVIRSHHPNQDIADKILARLKPAYMAAQAFVEEQWKTRD